MPEWSKGVDSSSTSVSCAGSNPAGVICALCTTCRLGLKSEVMLLAQGWCCVGFRNGPSLAPVRSVICLLLAPGRSLLSWLSDFRRKLLRWPGCYLCVSKALPSIRSEAKGSSLQPTLVPLEGNHTSWTAFSASFQSQVVARAMMISPGIEVHNPFLSPLDPIFWDGPNPNVSKSEKPRQRGTGHLFWFPGLRHPTRGAQHAGALLENSTRGDWLSELHTVGMNLNWGPSRGHCLCPPTTFQGVPY